MDSKGIENAKLNKGKSKLLVNNSENLVLHIKIQHTEGIDQKFQDTMKNPNCKKEDMRLYRVLGGLGEGLEFFTRPEQGFPDPSWNCCKRYNTLPLHDDMDCKYLWVEVLKLLSRQDPGTSTGFRVVGRATIPLPKELNQITHGRYGLVRKVGNGLVHDGHIIVTMQIKTYG